MKKVFYNSISYYALRAITFPVSFMPIWLIHYLGKGLGTLAYYFAPRKRRKFTFNNLALAKSLTLDEKQIKKLAKASFQNLLINGLEYFKLKSCQGKMDRFVKGHNLKPLYDLLDKGQGVICVTGHISNWELCFLDHTQKCFGAAIGKEIKNKKLYEFIQSIRTMHGGEIVEMKKAISYGIKKLKEGAFFSMVNDQAYTSSSYSYPFLGVRAWTSPAPALMAYKANAPLISVTTRRLPYGKYEYFLSDPIWPDLEKPLKSEVKRMMDLVMRDFEKEVTQNPGQWLWQHKRWKQEGYNFIKHKYKAESLLFILPKDKEAFDFVNEGLWVFPQIYQRSFLTFLVPEEHKHLIKVKGVEILTYKKESDLFIKDYRFQIIFDLTNNLKIKKHFLKLGAHLYFDLIYLMKTRKSEEEPFSSLLQHSLCLELATFKKPNFNLRQAYL